MSVYLLDDNAGVRTALTFAFESTGLDFCAFESPKEFLEHLTHDGPSCLILDLQLRGTTGLQCLCDPRFTNKVDMPVIILTGTADVSDVVRTMKLGAVDFLEKPADMELLIAKVREALEIDRSRLKKAKERTRLEQISRKITDRERDIIALICEGLSSKQIALRLGISVNTVANHRARLRQKTGATTTGELLHLIILADQLRAKNAVN